MNLSPILIFAYNRPDKIEKLLDLLSGVDDFKHSEVTIFVDGPKGVEDARAVSEVRRVVSQLKHDNLQTVFRSENLGLKNSIRTGVSKVFETHETVIVLEDDLEPAPGLLRYFNQALRKYRDCERVWSVSGYMYEVRQFDRRDEAIFLPFANPWGWATWRRCWNAPDPTDEQVAGLLRSPSFQRYFDVLGLRDFTSLLELDGKGLVSSWFIHWYLKIFYHGGLTLWPARSLVSNTGVGGGTHASALNFHRFLPRRPIDDAPQPRMPDAPIVDFDALDSIRASRDVKVQKVISRLGRYRRMLFGIKRRY